jgi:hypothetical protein
MPAPPEVVAEAQRRSWEANRRSRLLAIAKGQAAHFLRENPDGLPDLMEAMVAAARTEARRS